MKINRSTLISTLGIGIFGLLSILEFAHLIKYVVEQFLIIYFSTSKSSLWIPELVGTIIFTIGLVLCVKLAKLTIITNSKKWLFSLISIFFIITLLQFLSSFFGAGYLIETFPNEFDNYYDLRNQNFKLRAQLAFVPIFRYLILAIILIWEIRNHDDRLINRPTQNT